MTDHPTNGGAKPRTRTRAEERADSVPIPSRIELAERIEQLERELAEQKAAAAARKPKPRARKPKAGAE